MTLEPSVMHLLFSCRYTTSHWRATTVHCTLSLFSCLCLRAGRKPSSTCRTSYSPYRLATSPGGHYLYCLVTRWNRSALAHKTTSCTSFVWTDGQWGDGWYHIERGCTNYRGRPAESAQLGNTLTKGENGRWAIMCSEERLIWLGHILRRCTSKITGSTGPLNCPQPDFSSFTFVLLSDFFCYFFRVNENRNIIIS